jgi:hypothetical protein
MKLKITRQWNTTTWQMPVGICICAPAITGRDYSASGVFLNFVS